MSLRQESSQEEKTRNEKSSICLGTKRQHIVLVQLDASISLVMGLTLLFVGRTLQKHGESQIVRHCDSGEVNGVFER